MKRAWQLLFTFFVLGQGSGVMAYDLHDNAILHARRGQLFLEREQASEAIEEYKAAILLNPGTAMAASLYNNLGIAYKKAGQMALAIASFQHACRIQPTYALYYRNLIETYVEGGQARQALGELRKITLENPEDAEAWFMLGLLHKEMGDISTAKSCFERFLKLQPESELARAARTAL
jgi:protein O-GlcNAc transferase